MSLPDMPQRWGIFRFHTLLCFPCVISITKTMSIMSALKKEFVNLGRKYYREPLWLEPTIRTAENFMVNRESELTETTDDPQVPCLFLVDQGDFIYRHHNDMCTRQEIDKDANDYQTRLSMAINTDENCESAQNREKQERAKDKAKLENVRKMRWIYLNDPDAEEYGESITSSKIEVQCWIIFENSRWYDSSTRTILIRERTWTDVEPGKYSLSEFSVSKKLIHFLHGNLLRDNDGAIEFWRIKDNLQKHLLSCHHWSDEKWKKSMARRGGNKKRYQHCTDSSGIILNFQALQGHSGRNLIEPSFTGQCCYSERLLTVHFSCRMCNQFTLHHQFRIDTRRSNFEQQTDSILSACGSYGH